MRQTSEHAAARAAAVLGTMAALALAGCASGPRPPTVPEALKPPAGSVLFLETLARGVQVYECAPNAGDPVSYAWSFRAPEATLTDSDGSEVGKHYAGPTWDAPDGSRVLGEVKISAPAPGPAAIPWLLLGAKATFGQGVFTPTAYIQRVATRGGVMPTTPCSVDNVHQFARVPYTATYYFWRQR